MLEDCCIPNIVTSFDNPSGNSNNSLYSEIIRNTLKKILPSHIASTSLKAYSNVELRELIHSNMPLVTTSSCEKAPSNISFFVLSKYRSNAFKFFFEMISRWLVPGKRLNVVLIYAADFRMPDLGDDVYTLCEVMIHVEHESELQQILTNLPIIETEVCLGVESSYYARRILEVKGLTADEKTALIQEYIAYLTARLPKAFDVDVLTEMQHVLVMCRDDFKAARDCRHLSRIISIQYLFRKSLRESVKDSPQNRHLSIKLFKSKIHLPSGPKNVLCVLVGVNFLRDKEIFEKKHLLSAIQNYIPSAKDLDGSFFANRRGTEHIGTLYLEIEKNNGQDFTSDEIRILRKELPTDLKDRFEHLMHPVFMPRNEEEIMRYILSLSNQIKFLRDIPQVVVTFDEQTHSHLYFTVILVRVMMPGSSSLQDLFKGANTFLEYIHDRSKMVGYLRKKYTKEATVFRVKFPKEHFLRRDHTIDLYKARQTVVSELSTIIGEFRDFNGGMITKQNELLSSVRELLQDGTKYNDLLLENFFFSLQPLTMRTLLESEALKILFLMLLDAIDHGFTNDSIFRLRVEPDFVFLLFKAEENNLKDEVNKGLAQFNMHSTELASFYLKVHEVPYGGYIYRSDDPIKQSDFCQAIQNIFSRGAVQL